MLFLAVTRESTYSSLSLLLLTRSFSSSIKTSVKRKMPPKKAPVPEKKNLLGRPSNNLSMGFVGVSERATERANNTVNRV
jgi:hypothetical protein